jgi:PAS domain S-box-containing protein/putative nucleotidyltransferase with HDIG domain
MTDNFGDFLMLFNSEGKILYLNSHLLVTLDYAEEEIRSMRINDFFSGLANESIDSLFEYLSFTDRKTFRASFRRKDGTEIPVKTNNSRIIYEGQEAVISLSHDISTDLHQEKMEKEKLRILRENLGGVIGAIANAVEARDSYTAGHQQRVSNLARKIATYMNLPDHMIEGIRSAAAIHDIGKIAIPSDILNKSHALLELEFELIKHHTNVGFQILSTIEFPWPIAAIVYQHHEYIDGSGYPLGLEGSMMLTESKVVCVADVVEAMSTHRPYRPALGLEAAIEEINKFRGIRFDPDVVDACTVLYRNSQIDFNLSSAAKQNRGRRYF